jgi:prophage tail gpP-like protein
MLNVEVVTVIAGGAPYTDWEKISVTASLSEAVRTFTIETTEHPGQFRFPPGTPVQIYANGDLLIDGYVNVYESTGAHSSHRISVQGRGKGQDYIDSSAEHDTGFWEDKTPEDVAKELNKWGIGIKSEVPLDKIPYQQLKPGETPHQMVERYLRTEGVTQMGEPNGDILMTNASVAKSCFGILLEGQNILEYQVSLTDGSRHSNYLVKGQSRKGIGAGALRIKQQAGDKGVKRHRPKIIANETDTDTKRAKKRAEHEKERGAGRSIQATVKTQGFRDFAGVLFAPNKLIYVHAPILMHLVETMLIEGIQLDQDSKGGSISGLKLIDPRAYKGKGGGKGSAPGAPATDEESDPAWGLDADI